MGLIVAGLAAIDGHLFGFVAKRKPPINPDPASKVNKRDTDYQL